MASVKEGLWIERDYLKCTGCRRCEIACSLFHEGKIWPEASRIRVFMLIPGVEIPHFCSQCHDYPCVESCPVEALSINEKTLAVMVDEEKCTGCGICINTCPGKVPHLHPETNVILICDLCDGNPQCVKACTEANYNALGLSREVKPISYKLFSKTPEELTEMVAENLYAEKAKELM